MQQFFKNPTRRLRDRWEEAGDDSFEYAEVQLAAPVDEFLACRWDWAAFRAFVGDGPMRKIVWITEDTFLSVDDDLCLEDGNGDFGYIPQLIVYFTAKSGENQKLNLWVSDNSEYLPSAACSVLWHAMTTSNSVKLMLQSFFVHGLSSGPVLSEFLVESTGLLVLEFEGLVFEEEHCRALAALQRTDLEIEFNECTLEPQDAEDIFIKWFQRNQVVTDLYCCTMGSSTLSALISVNSSVKKLSFNGCEFGDEHIRSLAQALPSNQGIVNLRLTNVVMSDETWGVLFRAMSTHPRIKHLLLWHYGPTRPPKLSAESKTNRMHAIAQMLQHNTVVCTISLPDSVKDDKIYRKSILPRLEMNRSCFEAERQAMNRADYSIRAKLLGRALHVVRFNPNLLFQFLSENVPAFVRSEKDPIIISGQKRKAQSS
jgi:hypothetical protein